MFYGYRGKYEQKSWFYPALFKCDFVDCSFPKNLVQLIGMQDANLHHTITTNDDSKCDFAINDTKKLIVK